MCLCVCAFVLYRSLARNRLDHALSLSRSPIRILSVRLFSFFTFARFYANKPPSRPCRFLTSSTLTHTHTQAYDVCFLFGLHSTYTIVLHSTAHRFPSFTPVVSLSVRNPSRLPQHFRRLFFFSSLLPYFTYLTYPSCLHIPDNSTPLLSVLW